MLESLLCIELFHLESFLHLMTNILCDLFFALNFFHTSNCLDIFWRVPKTYVSRQVKLSFHRDSFENNLQGKHVLFGIRNTMSGTDCVS